MDLSILIVNHNGHDLLRRCLSSVYVRERALRFETIVIDNASTDASVEMVAREFPQVEVIVNQHNAGFAAANNQGIARSRGTYLLLLNSDTEIIGDALERSVEFLRGKPAAGIAGCKLLFPNGTLQRSARSFPDPWNLFCEMSFLYRVFPRSPRCGRYYLSYLDYETPERVDWLSGAYFLFDRKVVDRIGILDEQFFMYSEEMDYCLRAAQAGFETWYTPSATVIHHWLTVDKVTVRGIAWLLQSQLLYFEKHFSGFQRFLMKGFLFTGILIRLAVYPFAGLLGMKKKLFHQWRCLFLASWLVAKAGIHYDEENHSPISWARLT